MIRSGFDFDQIRIRINLSLSFAFLNHLTEKEDLFEY